MKIKYRPPIYFLNLLFLVFALAGCQGNAPAAVQNTATPSPSPIQATQPAATASSTPSPMGCTVVSPKPTPGPTEASLFPPIGKEDWVQGPEDASVTLLEYSDFQ